MSGIKFCKKCGRQVANINKYCIFCGTKLEDNAINGLNIAPTKNKTNLTNEKNITLLNDTLNIFQNGSYIKDGNEIKLKLSRSEQSYSVVLLPEQVNNICSIPPVSKYVEEKPMMWPFVENNDSFSVALKIKMKHPEEEVLVLNFANPSNPGGGARNGANAQEEDLCRRSSLLLSLEDDSARSYYNYNNSLNSYMWSDSIMINPKVEIIRDSDGELLDCSVVVSVMTCAAPYIKMGLDGKTKEEYEQLFYERILKTLKVATHYGYKYLVLGAWGCGAFGNEAELVARLYFRAIDEVCPFMKLREGPFKQIHFAVLDKSEDKHTYDAFLYLGLKGSFYDDGTLRDEYGLIITEKNSRQK